MVPDVPDAYRRLGASPPEVRRAVHADVDELAGVLARAFAEDPIASFMFRAERRRRRSLRRFFMVQLRHMFIDAGEAWTTEGRDGAALWAPPEMARPGLLEMWHLLPLLPSLVALGVHLGDAGRLVAAIERARPSRRHWYLATLGTDPDRQGRGIGSQLLAQVLRRLDAEGLPAYLETSTAGNVAFYRRHRFDVTGEADPVPGGPHLWFMWREPSPVGDADHP